MHASLKPKDRADLITGHLQEAAKFGFNVKITVGNKLGKKHHDVILKSGASYENNTVCGWSLGSNALCRVSFKKIIDIKRA